MDETEKRYNNVLTVIDKRLIPNEEAKKARGEVFTPLPLVREMLYGLRKSAKKGGLVEVWGVDESGRCIEDNESNRIGGIPLSVWRNPETTWLDPANGIGNFPVVAFYMLDYQLGEHGPASVTDISGREFNLKNKNERRKHIVENMLFMIELNKGNVNTSRKIFEQMVPGAKANICCADTLTMTDEKLMRVFKVKRFDVVMGNPPYQPSQLWEKFILKSLDFSKSDKDTNDYGIIALLVPTSWTSPTSASWKALSKKQLTLINNATYLKTDYFPKVSSTFSYFLVRNSSMNYNIDPKGSDIDIYYDKNTHFRSKLGTLKFVPKKITSETISINEKVLTNKLTGHFIRKDREGFEKEKSDTHIYPYITFVKRDGVLDIQYLNEKDPRQDDKKVLLFRNGYINPYYDNGENGVGSNIHALKVETTKEGENIVRLFNSTLYTYIFKVNSHTQYNHGGLMDMVFRDVSKIENFDDKDIYDFFHITPIEIETINNFLGNKRVGAVTTQKKPRLTATERQVATEAKRAETEQRKIERTEARRAASAARKASRKAMSLKKGGAHRSKYSRTRKVRRF